MIVSGFVMFSCFYMGRSATQTGPVLPFPRQSSESSPLTVAFLTFFSAFFLQPLTNSVCNDLRWHMGLSSDGIHYLGFAALGSATSITTLIRLLTWDWSRPHLLSGLEVLAKLVLIFIKGIVQRLRTCAKIVAQRLRNFRFTKIVAALLLCFGFGWLPSFLESLTERLRMSSVLKKVISWTKSYKGLALQRYILRMRH